MAKFNWGAALLSAGQAMNEYAERQRQEAAQKDALARQDRLIREERDWQTTRDEKTREQRLLDQKALYDYENPLLGIRGPGTDIDFQMPFTGTPIQGTIPGGANWPVDFGEFGLAAPTGPLREDAMWKYIQEGGQAKRAGADDPYAGLVDYTYGAHVPVVGGQTIKVSPGSVGNMRAQELDYLTVDFTLPSGEVIKVHPSQLGLMQREYYPGPATESASANLAGEKFEAQREKDARAALLRQIAGDRRTSAMTVRVGNTSVPEAFTYGSGGALLTDRDMRESLLPSNAYALAEKYAAQYADDIAAGTITPEQAYEFAMQGIMEDPEFQLGLPEGWAIDTRGTADTSDDVFWQERAGFDKRLSVEEFKMEEIAPLIEKMDNPAIGYAALNNLLKARGLTLQDYQTGGAPQPSPVPALIDTTGGRKPNFENY